MKTEIENLEPLNFEPLNHRTVEPAFKVQRSKFKVQSLLLGLLLAIAGQRAAATSFTEFYVYSEGGANINAGSTTSASAAYTSVNGNWDGTELFIPTDGSTPASTVSVGDWASVYNDGATTAVYIGRVTAVAAGVNGTITVSTTAKAGTAPTVSVTGRSIKVGGRWLGPTGASFFPFTLATGALTNTSGHTTRVNILGGLSNIVTAAGSSALNGPIRYEGYTNTVGDGGFATIDGTIGGAAYVMLTLSGANIDLVNLKFQGNGASSTATAQLVLSGTELTATRVVVSHHRGSGISVQNPNFLNECEVFSVGAANTALDAGFQFLSPAGAIARNCISHDNTTAKIAGFFANGAVTLINCIADSNGTNGFTTSSTATATYLNCDAYANGGHGIELTGSSAMSLTAVNCNFIGNAGYAITNSGSALRSGSLVNCGLGSGTAANTLGGFASTLLGVNESGTVTYAANATPWSAPATGNFSVILATAKNAGRGAFLQTAASYTGTVGYPDIGAAQSQGGAGGSFVFAQ